MAQKNTEKVYEFLKKAGTYYLATTDKEQPRVRPFGTILLFEDKLYLLTAKTKDVVKQIAANPKFELSAMASLDQWIRVSGELAVDNRAEVQTAMLEDYPHLKENYPVSGENTQTLYFKDATATIYSFTDEAEVLKL